MNFGEYEKNYQLYAEFAAAIQSILQKAISCKKDVPRPQSIQCRAKDPTHLKPKLEDRGLLNSEKIETEIKDLAGARIIFYTTGDVDKFLNSRVVTENFDVDHGATKIHHPTAENNGQQYRAVHYTITLKPERISLPEYAHFKGLRCEIQIQTVLIHAWAETGHDIIYKNRPKGFGSKTMEKIEERFEKVMDEYLLPAEQALRQIQHDYERLQQGKELFDRDIITSLKQAKDNNERHQLMTALKEHVLPNYDDMESIYKDLISSLVEVVKAARASEVKPISTPFGNLEGKTSKEVTEIAIDILSSYWPVGAVDTFLALCDIYQAEAVDDVKKHITDAIQRIAKYDLDIWEQAGSQVQLALIETIEQMTPEQQDILKSPIITVLEEALRLEIQGIRWSAQSAEIKSAEIPISDILKAMRQKTMTLLFNLFQRSPKEKQKRRIFYALWEVARPPIRGYSNELLKMTLMDGQQIIDFLTQHIVGQPYELLEHLEDTLLRHYHMAKQIADDATDRFGCRTTAASLVKSIETFRDTINGDKPFVLYKTLVGYEAVLPPHWDNEDFGFQEAHNHRKEQAEKFIDAITDKNLGDWLPVIERCASTESDDLATFPIFGEFLCSLAKRKPSIAMKILEKPDSPILKFLHVLLVGLSDSNAAAEYHKIISDYIKTGEEVLAVARHLRHKQALDVSMLEATLKKAIEQNDDFAVMECLATSIEKHGLDGHLLIDNVFTPAIKFLAQRQRPEWVFGTYFLSGVETFFSALTVEQCNFVLESMMPLIKIQYQHEKVLALIAKRYPELVWDFLLHRMSKDRKEKQGERYEASPFTLHDLREPLASNTDLAIKMIRSSFAPKDPMFQFNGGRLLSLVFPTLPENFIRSLAGMVDNGSDDDIDFALAIFQNYKGEPAGHPVLQAIVNKLPENDRRLVNVEIALRSAGVVQGPYGHVEAYRRKREELASWQNDSRPRVKDFAIRFDKKMEQTIAAEQRSAEQRQHDFEAGFEE